MSYESIVTAKELIQEPEKYVGKEILLRDVTLVSGSFIPYIELEELNVIQPSIYCLLELESGLVLPFGIVDYYVREVRPTTYKTLVKASEGKIVSARGLFREQFIDTQELEDIIAQVPEEVERIHSAGLRLSDELEEIASGIDPKIRDKLTDWDGLGLHQHYFMEGYIIPYHSLFRPK